jgi:hypothetical protein
MHITPDPKEDSAAGMTPAIQHTVPWRVVAATAQEGYRIQVLFVDGLTGTVDLSQLVKSESAGIFAALADSDLFQQLFVEHGAVTWPNELDLAPDAMYDEIKRSGCWVIH